MDVFPDDVCFQIDDGAGMFIHEGRIGHRMGNNGNGELTVADGNDGQADAVDGDRPFFDDEDFHVLGNGNGDDPGNAVIGNAGDVADAIDVAADDVTAEPSATCMARSKLTLEPLLMVLNDERRIVSCMTSAEKVESVRSVTVRQTPLTAMLSPSCVPSNTL